MLTLYSKTNCAGCVSAAKYLTTMNIPFAVTKIDENPAAKEFLLSQGHRAVPQIYYGDKLFVFGGWPALMKMSEVELQEHMELFRKDA